MVVCGEGAGRDKAVAGAKSMLREWMVLDVVKLTRVEARERKEGEMTSLLAATLCPSDGVAAGRLESGGHGVALPCASAKRSRLLPELFDDCSCVGRRLSPRVRVIIREVNESVLSLNFLETVGIGLPESCEEWCSTSCA